MQVSHVLGRIRTALGQVPDSTDVTSERSDTVNSATTRFSDAELMARIDQAQAAVMGAVDVSAIVGASAYYGPFLPIDEDVVRILKQRVFRRNSSGTYVRAFERDPEHQVTSGSLRGATEDHPTFSVTQQSLIIDPDGSAMAYVVKEATEIYDQTQTLDVRAHLEEYLVQAVCSQCLVSMAIETNDQSMMAKSRFHWAKAIEELTPHLASIQPPSGFLDQTVSVER